MGVRPSHAEYGMPCGASSCGIDAPLPSGFSEDFTEKHGRPAAAPVNVLVTSPEGQSCFLSGACQGPLHFFKFGPHDLVGYITDSLTALKEPVSFTPFSHSLSKHAKCGNMARPGVWGARPGGEARGSTCVFLGKPLEDVGLTRVAGMEGETFHMRVLGKAEHSIPGVRNATAQLWWCELCLLGE